MNLASSLAVAGLMLWGCTSLQAAPDHYQYCHVPPVPPGGPWPHQLPAPDADDLAQAYRFPPERLLRQPEQATSNLCSRPATDFLMLGTWCSGASVHLHDTHCGAESFSRGYCSPQGRASDIIAAGQEPSNHGNYSSGDWTEWRLTRAMRPAQTVQETQAWWGGPHVLQRFHPIGLEQEVWRVSTSTPVFKMTGLHHEMTNRAIAKCYTMAHLFGFFNGVWNTRREAEDSLEEMKKQDFLGPTWREAPVRYELFYNQTCKRSEDDVCLQDAAEVFRQRSAELDGLLARRWEYFWEQVTGQHDQPGSFTQRLLARLVRSDNALANWFDGLYNALLAKITVLSTLLAENPPTAQDTAAHTAQLIAAGQRAERAVLVAHSQGNLFVNAAYDAYLAHARAAGRAQGEDTNYVAAQVVHIAPASPTLRGPYVLADIDLVINGLRQADGTYLAVSNFNLAPDAKDRSGHKLLSTYLDEARPARAHILQLIRQGLDAL